MTTKRQEVYGLMSQLLEARVELARAEEEYQKLMNEMFSYLNEAFPLEVKP